MSRNFDEEEVREAAAAPISFFSQIGESEEYGVGDEQPTWIRRVEEEVV